jgi:Na+-translocating ferredoxin:NAD+ oxidoreductase RnfD subunit
VVTTWLFGRLYFAATGIYFFYDSYIPIAVFLGMHLLFNDPSTSPRTEPGRIMYGALYGLSTVGLYELLGRAGMPTFYDKLLQVPFLNLSVKVIDRATRSWPVLLGQSLLPRERNL